MPLQVRQVFENPTRLIFYSYGFGLWAKINNPIGGVPVYRRYLRLRRIPGIWLPASS